ncbi:Transporter, LysE family [hydrothermal vent metagenome]|uniref:Transporter, LysE family n=1 Tax=hydrothermal vent metagenome TaxID=652676 RepID=A0A1W1E178_9ZZZZ
MNFEYGLLFFGLMFPLVFSPGPANIVFAMSGMKQGVKKSIPLIIGVDLVFMIYSLIIGFGLGEVLKHYPNFIFILQLLGAFYIGYLAYKFIKPVKRVQEKQDKYYTFKDGVILQMLNPKGWTMLFLMFSVLLDGSFDKNVQIIYLVIMLAMLNISTHFIWVAAGSGIAKLIQSPMIERGINYFFAVSLLLVAIWLLLSLRL